MADREDIDDGTAGRQAGQHPIARALRSTYDADNHDSLGSDLTGLMLELARVDDALPAAPAPPPSTAVLAVAAPAPRSWLRRLFG